MTNKKTKEVYYFKANVKDVSVASRDRPRYRLEPIQTESTNGLDDVAYSRFETFCEREVRNFIRRAVREDKVNIPRSIEIKVLFRT